MSIRPATIREDEPRRGTYTFSVVICAFVLGIVLGALGAVLATEAL